MWTSCWGRTHFTKKKIGGSAICYNFNPVIRLQESFAHDMACVIFCSISLIEIGMRTNLNLHWIWVVLENHHCNAPLKSLIELDWKHRLSTHIFNYFKCTMNSVLMMPAIWLDIKFFPFANKFIFWKLCLSGKCKHYIATAMTKLLWQIFPVGFDVFVIFTLLFLWFKHHASLP